MKKRFLLFVMMLTMILSALILANTVSAACTVSSTTTNIASSATATTSSTYGEVIVENLTDGKNRTGTFTRYGSFTFTFDSNKSISSVAVYTNDSNIKVYNIDGYNSDQTPIYSDTTTTAKVGKVKVQFLSETDEIIWDSGDIDTSSKTGLITIEAPDVYSVKKVVFHITDADTYGWSPLGEILIYQQLGAHDWTLTNPTTPSTCTEAGEGDYTCTCGATKTDVIYPTGHTESSYKQDLSDETLHYTTCLNPNCSLEPQTRISEGTHIYDHECDTTCNLCNYERTVEGHLYVSDCDQYCNKCSESRTPITAHTFQYTCTPECPNCREANPNFQPHTYDSDCDATCNFCQTERVVNPHQYNSACDEDCNVAGCDYERNAVSDPDLIPHSYTSDCDTGCNNEGCVYVRQPLMAHPFKNKCDERCDKCNALNPDYVAGHIYDHDCDNECNECSQKRNVSDHKYDNVCDFDCNTCGTQRTVSKHIYGEWLTLVPATETAEGIRAHYCINCQKEEQETLPMIIKEGLGTGAIIAIVASSVVVVGACAGVGVYSLVIKPKKEAKLRQELEAKKKAEEEDDDEDYEDDEDSES